MNKMKTNLKLKSLIVVFGAIAITTASLSSCKKKEGCTDPAADNYDPDAKKNCDNCCVYPEPPAPTGKKEAILNSSAAGIGTRTLYKDTVYFLNGFVFVNNGQTLTIEAGTVIKGKAGQGSNASALVVARGGKIMANGTATNPIIFTFENDPLDGSVPVTTRGQWGGLIILGKARLNSSPGETQIEGIPTTETRGLYGGTDDNDNSGVLKYVSIRHGGTDIGAGNEINGLTLGGVGSGTTIEYVEVIANNDDGIEFFGGTARVKYAVTAFCGDDSYDYDEGFRGFGQFWFSVYEPGDGDRGGEHDGGTTPENGLPYAHPIIYNATYLGKGVSYGNRAITFRDNAGGEYHNSIFQDWGKGFDVENLASGEDSYNRFVNNELAFAGNVFWNVTSAGSGATASDLFKISMGSGWATPTDSINNLNSSSTALQASFTANGNSVTNPGIANSFSAGGINPKPSNSLTAGNAPANPWFTNVTYKGAFDPSGTVWLKGWTKLDGYEPNGTGTSYIQ